MFQGVLNVAAVSMMINLTNKATESFNQLKESKLSTPVSTVSKDGIKKESWLDSVLDIVMLWFCAAVYVYNDIMR